MTRAFVAVIGMCICLAFGRPSAAQDIAVSASRVLVGQPFVISYDLPERATQPRYKLALIPEGQDQIPLVHSAQRAGPGQWQFEAPQIPGKYLAVIARVESEVAIKQIPVEVVFQPTPGALEVSKTDVTSGETVSVSVSVPENRRYPRLWVGLFGTGWNSPQGGASVGDERISYRTVGADGTAGQLQVPRWPGEYEIRLFDRTNGPYVLDRVKINVTAPPQPGVLSLDKQVYEVGSAINVGVSAEASLNFRPWVALYSPEKTNGGGTQPEAQIQWAWLDAETRQWQVPAPAEEGTYEIRLFDNGNNDFRFLLDTAAFRVVASPQENAMKIDKDVFIAGETVNIPVRFDPTRGQYRPWIGLFDAQRTPSEGNAPQSVHRHSWAWVTNGEAAQMQVPVWPGAYEFRLYDRNARRFLLDTHPFTVTVPPTPEALRISNPTLDVGEPFSIVAALPQGRRAISPRVDVYEVVEPVAAGGAGVSRPWIAGNQITLGEPLAFNGIATPGRYVARLYDRRERGFVLDELEFNVAVKPLGNLLSTNKQTYRTGEQIAVTMTLPANRNLGSPYLGLFTGWEYGEGNAPTDRARVQRVWLKPDVTDYSFVAPATPGRYELVALDRQNNGYELARTQIAVISDGADLMRISKRSFAPGELIGVQTRVPQDRALYSPTVRLMQSSFIQDGVAIAVETPIRSRAVSASETEAFELPAPSAPGKYELRYYDRTSRFFILDIEEFTVATSGAQPAGREYVRLTPMPGAGRSEMPSLPGDRPSPSNTAPDPSEPATAEDPAEPDPASAEAPAEDAVAEADPSNDGSDPNGSDAAQPSESDRAGDQQAGPPRLLVEALTPAGMQPVTEIAPGASFRVQVSYARAPETAPGPVTVALSGGAGLSLPLRSGDRAGLYLTDVVRVPTGLGN